MRSNFNLLIKKATELHNIGNFFDAKKIYLEALKIKPNDYNLLKILSSLEFHSANLDKSLQYIESAIKIENNSSELLSMKALILYKLNKIDSSVFYFQESLKIDPKNISSLLNLGVIHKEIFEYKKALEYFDKIEKLNNNHYTSILYKAYVLYEIQLFEKSIIQLNKITTKIKDYSAYLLRGNSYMALNNFEKSINDFEFIITDKNKCDKKIFYDAVFNKSLLLLMNGNYREGWKYYEYRFKAKKVKTPFFLKNIPYLKNISDVKNKSLLIHGEQGIGDNIQFFRYIYLLKKYTSNITFIVNKKLIKFFNNSKLDINIVSTVDNTSNYDFHCPLMSLPYKFLSEIDTIPQSSQYIFIKNENIKKWNNFFPKNKFNIGINWAASSNTQVDKGRSFNLNNIKKISFIKNVNLYSLQKKIDFDGLEKNNLKINFFNKLDEESTFIDTAPIISNLDLVITCDTSIAHLAGSLEKKTFLVLQKNSEWRWLRNTDFTPWYKSIKIFRQKVQNDWTEPFNKIESEIKKMLN